jgi:hypothetical protein
MKFKNSNNEENERLEVVLMWCLIFDQNLRLAVLIEMVLTEKRLVLEKTTYILSDTFE